MLDSLWLLIPIEIRLVLDEVETPVQEKAICGADLLAKECTTNAVTRRTITPTALVIFCEVVILASLMRLTLAVSGAGTQTPDMQTGRRPGVRSTALVRRHL